VAFVKRGVLTAEQSIDKEFVDRSSHRSGSEGFTDFKGGPAGCLLFRCAETVSSNSLKILFALLGMAAACGLSVPAFCAPPRMVTEGFDDLQPSWRVLHDRSQVQLLSQRRNQHIFVHGRASENVELRVAKGGAAVRFEHPVQPARIIDELSASLWLRSNRPGATLSLRIIFPHQKDPTTGAVLSMYLRGDRYTKVGEWQQLRCTTLDKHVRKRLIPLRAMLKKTRIDTRGLYVDRVVIEAEPPPGTTEFFIDELRFGPIVDPRNDTDVRQASSDNDTESPVEFRLDRMYVDGRPFFPRFAPYHGERLGDWKKSGMNIAWVPDYTDNDLLAQLRQHDLWAMAVPPNAKSSEGTVLDPQAASLVPFGVETRPILMWYPGTRVAPSERKSFAAWSGQIRNADQRFRRPLMLDVTGDEREYSRLVGMLGTSRHVLNTTFSLNDYQAWLLERRRQARPGSFLWTWIQTEAAKSNTRRRAASDQHPIAIEPEQIRLQTYAALAAGSRGLGFWTTTPLDDRTQESHERRLAVSQLGLELGLLEPWLATGTLVGQVPFHIAGESQGPIGRRNLDFQRGTSSQQKRNALLKLRDNRQKRAERVGNELKTAIIRCDYGLLLLPVWYQHDAQFVPGQMAGNDATIVVPGADESAWAWEVTTTGVRSLTRERVTGGIKITIPKFDQTAAVVLSADRSLITQLRKKVQAIAPRSAQLSLDLARSKLARVRTINAELNLLRPGQLDAPQLLARADALVKRAEAARERGDYHATREFAADTLQVTRILQRAHWDDAVRGLSSPTSSPHTVCFQTLPDHWRMIAAIGRSPLKSDANLLRSGNFEDRDTMIVEGWKHTQNRIDGIRATAELYPSSRKGKYALRLIAGPEPGTDLPSTVLQNPVRVTTPAINVHAGQVVHVSGWIRVAAPITGNLDGVLVYDSISGSVGALRFRDETADWQRFEIIRESRTSKPFTVTIALTGLGEVRIDDLRIVPHSPHDGLIAPPRSESKPADAKQRAIDFLNRLPKLPSLPLRR
jgi:hypothetical protein